MITRCAGRLTPQAKVLVHTRICRASKPHLSKSRNDPHTGQAPNTNQRAKGGPQWNTNGPVQLVSVYGTLRHSMA